MDRNALRVDFKRIIVAAAIVTVLRCRTSRFAHTVALWKVSHVFGLANVSRELDLPRLRAGLCRPIDSGVDGLPDVPAEARIETNGI